MNLKLFIFLQFISVVAHSQAVVRGKVFDEKSDQPLPYANVYINYTTIGTNSDDKGSFSLTLDPGDHDLVVSFVGHKPYQVRISLKDGEVKELTVRLALLPMAEIQIKAKRDASWDKQLEKFNKFFLGSGPNAKLSKILNPWVLNFPETTNGVFSAQATDVLEIENLALGYRVSYELKNFGATADTYLVAGYVRFKELITTDPALAKRWTENRTAAYEGSTRHLFKSIIEQCIDEEQYELYEDRSDLTQLVRDYKLSANVDKTIFRYSTRETISPGPRPHVYKVQLPSRLEVHYKGKDENSTIYTDVHHPISWIETNGPLFVDDDGFVLNPLKLTVLGAMFQSRVAELLPNNYEPLRKVALYKNPIERKPLSSLTYLTEKPYLQTDKSYYYPNEVVWLKGYMNYFSNHIKDSLSHVLYVDLVDKNGKAVWDGSFPITNNSAVGDFSIPSYVEHGDYTLRAYTRWMLNFDPSYIYKKPIKILSYGELAKTQDYNPDESNNTVNIVTEKVQFDPREKITLSLYTRNAYDSIVPASYSVSVTDLSQVVPAANERSIDKDFRLPVVQLPDTLDKRTRLTIQHGFDVRGKFTAKKEKFAAGLLRFVQPEASMEFIISTEEDGSFFIPNLILYDTAKLSVVGQSKKGKPVTIQFDSMVINPGNGVAEPLQLETYIAERPVQRYIPDFTTTKILEEVTITAERIEKKKFSQVMADFNVSGEWIRESRAVDVLSALQLKVPGLRVIIRTDGGIPTKYLLLGNPSTFMGNTKTKEPLVLIDNMVVNDMIGGAAAQIETLNVNEVESVEVSRFGTSAAYGARGGNGVISIHTGRNRVVEQSALGAYDKKLLQPLPVKGFSSVRKFISPDYSTPEKNTTTPDTRSTIYWNPSIQSKNKPAVVTFFAADLPTRYRIVVEGVTSMGNAVRGEKIITVAKQN